MIDFEKRVIELLEIIISKLDNIESECSSVASNTWYLDSDIKDDINDIKRSLK